MPVNFQEKRDCWNSLASFLADKSFSSIIVNRNLNITMDAKEKKGGVCGRDPMLNLVENLIQTWRLIDFKPKKEDIRGQVIELEQQTSLPDWIDF